MNFIVVLLTWLVPVIQLAGFRVHRVQFVRYVIDWWLVLLTWLVPVIQLSALMWKARVCTRSAARLNDSYVTQPERHTT